MKSFKTLPDFWQTYFQTVPSKVGVDVWTIVFVARDKDDLLFSLSNPFTEEQEEVFVQNVTPYDSELFMKHYKQRFLEQLSARFGFFKPAVDHVLTEYPQWESFYTNWLNNDPDLTQGNFPLLFDFPSQQEYRAMQLKNTNYAGYRRMLIVLYQYRKNQFQRIFIQNVSDKQFVEVQAQIAAMFKAQLPMLMMAAAGETHVA